MRLFLDNLPHSLTSQRLPIERCLRAMDKVMPLDAVYLFGSHARGDSRHDSDVDLCIISHGASQQIPASRRLSEPLLGVWPRPSLTLIPITPSRLAEKRAVGDHFFQTVLAEGILLAAKD